MRVIRRLRLRPLVLEKQRFCHRTRSVWKSQKLGQRHISSIDRLKDEWNNTAQTLKSRGHALVIEKNYTDASNLYQWASLFFDDVGDKEAEADSLASAGWCEKEKGDLTSAASKYQSAYDLTKENHLKASILFHQACILMRGDFKNMTPKVATMFKTSAQLYREAGDEKSAINTAVWAFGNNRVRVEAKSVPGIYRVLDENGKEIKRIKLPSDGGTKNTRGEEGAEVKLRWSVTDEGNLYLWIDGEDPKGGETYVKCKDGFYFNVSGGVYRLNKTE